MTRSYIIAAIFAFVIGAWIVSGMIGENGEEVEPAGSIAEAQAEIKSMQAATFKVQAREFTSTPHQTEIVLRGATKAERIAQVRAETSGRIVRLPREKGERVNKGDVLCQLDIQEREARMTEARAFLKQRELEYQAAEKLQAKGHRSETATAAVAAGYDAAKAAVERMEIELANTKVRAPFAGVIEDLPSEIGELLQMGAPCAVLVDEDPFLITAQISEREVQDVAVGDTADVTLINGYTTKGTVRFVASAANPATRTFLIEVQIANPDRVLREGLTATLILKSREVPAHYISKAILTMDDDGVVGVRSLDAGNQVRFKKITPIAEDREGVWVTDLPDQLRIITSGQEFVYEGQQVEVDIMTGENGNTENNETDQGA